MPHWLHCIGRIEGPLDVCLHGCNGIKVLPFCCTGAEANITQAQLCQWWRVRQRLQD